MGILESLINGSDGIVAKAFQFFGTIATLSWRETGNENDTTIDVLFIPEKISESDLIRENGLGSKRTILTGMICVVDGMRIPKAHTDTIQYQNIRYRITEVDQELIGESGTILSIIAIR